MIDLQDTERDLFKRMNTNDQNMALFDMVRYVRGEIAGTKRAVLDLQNDITEYRRVREVREIPINTEQKIETALNKRFDFWKYLLDKVIPGILQLAIIALLYLIFALKP